MSRPSDLVDAAYNLGLYESLKRVADDLEEAAMTEFFEGEQEKAYILRDLYTIWKQAAADQAPAENARSFNMLRLSAVNWDYYTRHTKPEPGEEVLGWHENGSAILVVYDAGRDCWSDPDLLYSLDEIPIWQKLVPPK